MTQFRVNPGFLWKPNNMKHNFLIIMFKIMRCTGKTKTLEKI